MPLRPAAELVFAGVAGFVLGAAGVLMSSGDDLPVPPPAPTAWLALWVGLAAAAAFLVLASALGRRNRPKRELLRWAVRTGRLPDIDASLLRRVLRERADLLGTWRWSWLAIGALQLLLAGSHLIAPTSESVYSRAFWGLELLFWIAVMAIWTARAWWERPRVLRLLAELDERVAQREDA